MSDTDKREDILRKVRALLAKAASTEFEAERQTFLAKADQLMEAYSIDEAMLKLQSDPNAKVVERRDMDISWWYDLRDIDPDAKNNIYWLWNACITHCRCVSSISTWKYRDKTSSVYGTKSDLDYLNLLFTDLFMQLVAKLKPAYDPKLPIGANVRLAKEAGMTWDQILDWTGLRNDPLGKRLLPAYRKYCEANGLSQVKTNPKTFQWSFTEGYCVTVKQRLREMRGDREQYTGSGKELALRSIEVQAKEELYNDFPDLRPHEADCQCKDCSARRKPIKAGSYRTRTYSYLGSDQGAKAGANARIISNDPKLRKQPELK
jgi:hypothetical protein